MPPSESSSDPCSSRLLVSHIPSRLQISPLSYSQQAASISSCSTESITSARDEPRIIKLPRSPIPEPVLLLARPDDELYVSPLHVLLRKHIQVVQVTQDILNRPAPGRKFRLALGQVVLQCAHCQGRGPTRRAACVPSSLERIYHAVSDMKGDHLLHCASVPRNVRQLLATSRDRKRKSTQTTTVEYYAETAQDMGLVRGVDGGVYFANACGAVGSVSNRNYNSLPTSTCHEISPPTCKKRKMQLAATQTLLDLASIVPTDSLPSCATSPTSSTSMLLALDTDADNLNGLHCFVRRHVELFLATPADVRSPMPGRKIAVSQGQVGLRCVHCARASVKRTTKRAVCYPPNVAGIYHAISNMKFDHFGACANLPPAARVEFAVLRACKKQTSATARYYERSARRLGLVDTIAGMRFADPLDALVIAATDPNLGRELEKRRSIGKTATGFF
jgi:hypothetical protein